MSESISVLAVTAVSIAFLHTLFGPDHYLPFIAISKAKGWNMRKTLFVTFLSGLGHVLGSVILGFIGISLGLMINKIELFESMRGNLAAWAFIAFGLIYFVWGLKKAFQHKHPSHFKDATKKDVTIWTLFIIFVLGPCEPLIPILMYPAAQNNFGGLVLVTSLFAIVTIGTMMSVVFLAASGLKFVKIQKLQRFSHSLAGFVILMSGVGIQFLGL